MKKLLFFAFVAFAFVACQNSDGNSLSSVISQMADMRVNGKKVVSIITDDNDSLLIPDNLTVSETLARTDTIYRMLLYYTQSEGKPISIVSNRSVALLNPTDASQASTLKYDPLESVALWQSNNNKYINLTMAVAASISTAETQKHKFALVADSVKDNSVGKKHYYYSLRHDQGGTTGNYVVETICSMPLSAYSSGDEIDIYVKTQQKDVVKTFVKK